MIEPKKAFIFCLLLMVLGCSRNREKSDHNVSDTPEKIISVPRFNSDSAYSFVEAQVMFGPRIPNTAPHEKTAAYLVAQLKKYGASVTVQDFETVNYTGQALHLKNIIGSYGLQKQKRILLAAHWDTRPFADKDQEKPDALFDGANDGASGIGILLEFARLMKNSDEPAVGIDIIFFDGEDWGEKNGEQSTMKLPEGYEEWWCLGSQYWSLHKHKPNYSAYYGILLDLVGAKDSRFYTEGTSLEYAPLIVKKVWGTAAKLGYGDIFINQNPGSITDDHLFVNQNGKIPMIDIIHYDPIDGYFGSYHHTRKDNLALIDKATLEIVGKTILQVVYEE